MSQELFRRQYGQWVVVCTEDDYVISNVDGHGIRRFFQVVKGPYGNPLMDQEPDRKLPIPDSPIFVDALGNLAIPKPHWGIIGFICRDKNGVLIHRSSLSNPSCPLHRWIGITFEVAGKTWYPKALIDKDRDRMIGGYVLYCTEEPQQNVKILELGDLVL